MSTPTVFGTARFGIADDSTATGLHLASLGYAYSTEQARAKDHNGFSVGLSLFEDMAEVSFGGVVKTKTTGFVLDLGDAIVLANESDGSLSLNDQNMMSTPVANAGTVITGLNLNRTNSDFETGDGSAMFLPLVALS